MSLWTYAVWGLLGAFFVEALELYDAVHRVDGFPWRQPGEVSLAPYLVSVVLRLLLGVGLVVAFRASNQLSGYLAAFFIGAASPLVLERIARAVPTQVPENKRAVQARLPERNS